MNEKIIGIVTFLLCGIVLATVIQIGEYGIWKHDKEEEEKDKHE